MSEHKKSISELNEETRNKKIAMLRDIGIGEFTDEVIASPWQVPVDQIICSHRGKAIICQSPWSSHIVQSFNSLVAREIESLKMSNGNESIIVFTSHQTLTIPERHTLDTMNAYFESNYPGFQCEDDWVYFPKAMEAYAAPAEYKSEADAFESAEVLAAISGMESRVIKTIEGYAVALHDKMGDLTDWNALCVIGAIQVLERFTCTRKSKECLRIDGDGNDTVHWQQQVAELFTQQQRIETALGEILCRLDQNVATGTGVGSTTTEHGRGRGLAALIPSKNKKPSAKSA